MQGGIYILISYLNQPVQSIYITPLVKGERGLVDLDRN